MRVFEKSFDFLYNEFSNISVHIETKETYSHSFSKLPETGILEDPQRQYDFTFTFNSDFHVDNYDQQEINHEYYKYLEVKKLEFYQEIDDLIFTETSLLKVYTLLRGYKVRFIELLSNYYSEKFAYSSSSYEFLNYKIISETINNAQRIDNIEKRKILHSFLRVQKETIENIIRYIDDKLTLIQTNEPSNEDIGKGSKSRDHKPITKIDQYQAALLFNYLVEVGAIKEFGTYQGIADEVSKLTGFSRQKLRTNCFPKILEIKTGKQGNIPSLRKDPDTNLKTVKNLIVEINNKIHEDLQKNYENRAKK